MKVSWALAAAEGREAIIDYIFERNPLAALELDENIDQAIEQLKDLPHLWSPGRVPATRERVVDDVCRIISRIESAEVHASLSSMATARPGFGRSC